MRAELYSLTQANNFTFASVKARKLIEKIKKTDNVEKLDISFDELKSMYQEIGYDIFYKRGSHAIVQISEEINIPVVIPHKRKNVHPFDLKRFKYILSGELEKAKNTR